ncbi:MULTISPECIES: LysR family transcriptional regulator [unclassified Halomonas]|uniref:LysR family transcriptional regulator n=1 Tax=unclassified Halomonas TaxID=2609666 RepID=UPI00209DAD5C|nr:MULTISPECIES: LysR family transcriptional regulator [unclassified Halomonas]MCP1312912.1 LysR family transcriptional regulator [Halomonas sp. 707D7]MCP1325747.1 LysR family transcriptional regulator [Halomonas sp. 707D4]
MISGRALHYFDTVARCRSLRQAAAMLNIAPTAISRQIDQLEEQLGAPLLERSPNGITLTDAGELLAAQACETLRDFERVQEHIADLKDLRVGRVRLGAAEGVVAGLLAPALADMGRDYPRLRFDIGITSAGQVVERLRQGTVDIGVSFFTPRHDDITVLQSAWLEHHAVMRADHPLASAKEVSLEQLSEHRVILPDASFGARQAIERSALRAGIKLLPSFDTASLETQKALALNGAGILILPPMAVARECACGELVSVALGRDEFEAARMDLCVYRHRTRSFAVETCVSLLSRSIESMSSQNV